MKLKKLILFWFIVLLVNSAIVYADYAPLMYNPFTGTLDFVLDLMGVNLNFTGNVTIYNGTLNASFDCNKITGSDDDFCADATGTVTDYWTYNITSHNVTITEILANISNLNITAITPIHLNISELFIRWTDFFINWTSMNGTIDTITTNIVTINTSLDKYVTNKSSVNFTDLNVNDRFNVTPGGVNMSENLVISGNVGVGVSDPLRPFVVASDATFDPVILQLNKTGATTGSFELGVSAGKFSNLPPDTFGFITTTRSLQFQSPVTGDIILGDGTIATLILKGGGNLGLGMVVPTQTLVVSGNASILGDLNISQGLNINNRFNVSSGGVNMSQDLVVSGTLNSSFDCSKITGSADDFCVDATGGGGITNNSDANLTSLNIRDKFNVTPGGVNMSENLVISGNVGVGVIPTVKFQVKETDSGSTVPALFEITRGGAFGVNMQYIHSTSSPADGDQSIVLSFVGRDDTAASTTYATIATISDDVTNTTEDGGLKFTTFVAGASTQIIRTSGGSVRIGSGGTVNSATGVGDEYIQDDLEIDGVPVTNGVYLCITATGLVTKSSGGGASDVCTAGVSPFYYVTLPSGKEYEEAEFLANLDNQEDEIKQYYDLEYGATRYGKIYEKKEETSYIDLVVREIEYVDTWGFGLFQNKKSIIQSTGYPDMDVDDGIYYEMVKDQILDIDWGELPIDDSQITSVTLITKGYYITDVNYYKRMFNLLNKSITKITKDNRTYYNIKFSYELKDDTDFTGTEEFNFYASQCKEENITTVQECKDHLKDDLIPQFIKDTLKNEYMRYERELTPELDLGTISLGETQEIPLYYCSTNPSREENCHHLSSTLRTCYHTEASSPRSVCTGGEWLEV